MKEPPDDLALLASVTSPKKLASELMPLLRVRFLDETPASLRRLVQPSDTDLRLLQMKLGANAAERVRATRQKILAELENLLREREGNEIRP